MQWNEIVVVWLRQIFLKTHRTSFLIEFCLGPHVSMCISLFPLQWRHNMHHRVSNRRYLDWLLNRLFRRRSRKHQSSASLALMRWPMDSPHKGPVTRKMFPFDDVIMLMHWFEQTKWWVYLCMPLQWNGLLHVLFFSCVTFMHPPGPRRPWPHRIYFGDKLCV